MIELSRINGKKFYLNADLIKTVEATPDTVITLFSGAGQTEKMMVKESVEEVIRLSTNYWKKIHQEPVSEGRLTPDEAEN